MTSNYTQDVFDREAKLHETLAKSNAQKQNLMEQKKQNEEIISKLEDHLDDLEIIEKKQTREHERGLEHTTIMLEIAKDKSQTVGSELTKVKDQL